MIPLIIDNAPLSNPVAADVSSLELAPFDASELMHHAAVLPLLDRLERLQPAPPPKDAAEIAPSQASALSASTEPGPDRASTLIPLDPGELFRLVTRLEHAVTMNGQRTTIIAALSALVLITTIVESDSHNVSTAAAFGGFVSLIVMLGAVVWRVIAPDGMRQVVRAVYETPEYVVLLRHSRASTSIEIKTATHGLMVNAGNAPWLLDALMRRCPTAKVELR